MVETTDHMDGKTGSSGMFQERLNELFAASETRLTNLAVAKGLLLQDFRISTPYLSQLRNGVRDNPSEEVVVALATYFGVSTSYFFDDSWRGGDETSCDGDAEIVDQLTDPATKKLLTLAQGLSARSTEILADIALKLSIADRRTRHRPRLGVVGMDVADAGLK